MTLTEAIDIAKQILGKAGYPATSMELVFSDSRKEGGWQLTFRSNYENYQVLMRFDEKGELTGLEKLPFKRPLG